MITWLFPACCPVCRRLLLPKGALIHKICETQLLLVSEPICKKCGRQLKEETEELCAECMAEKTAWDMGRSVYLYQGAAGRLIRTVKQTGEKEVINFLGRKMALQQGAFLRKANVQCIVPVPLHKRKQNARGFNQAELLAMALGREVHLPVRKLIIKTKKTKEQKSLARKQRKENVRNAYYISRKEIGNDVPKAVLLLDDVITTGSTLNACAEVLKEAGVKRVYFLTVCSGE